MRALVLPNDAEELVRVIDQNWTHIDADYTIGKDEGETKRRALVVVLERVTGADLEKRIDGLWREAAAT